MPQARKSENSETTTCAYGGRGNEKSAGGGESFREVSHNTQLCDGKQANGRGGAAKLAEKLGGKGESFCRTTYRMNYER
jgi:hypothetical protein